MILNSIPIWWMYTCINQMYLLHSYSSSHSYKCGAYHLIHTFVERFILKSCAKYCGIIHNQKRINNIIISFYNIYFLRHIYKLWWIKMTITTMHFNNSSVCWEFVILKPCHRIWTKNSNPEVIVNFIWVHIIRLEEKYFWHVLVKVKCIPFDYYFIFCSFYFFSQKCCNRTK